MSSRNVLLRGWMASLIVGVSFTARGQEPVLLMPKAAPLKGWSFNNGAEFPGAKGGLKPLVVEGREARSGWSLVGDFSGGGGYVQAGRKLDDVDIRELSLWVRNPFADRFTLRLTDASKQTHQISLKTEPGPEWQRVVLPLEKFFARRGEADAVTNVAKYESWGGAKDGRWHGPAAGVYFVLSNRGEPKVRNLDVADVTIEPRPTPVAGAETTKTIQLDEILAGAHDWRFSNGPEFKGAVGALTVVDDGPEPGRKSLKLAGDFTGGGAYVAAIKSLAELDVADVAAVRLRVKSANAKTIGIQLVDGTGQTHQRRDYKITADGAWHELILRPAEIAGGEHWGGANDGAWHAPAKLLSIALSNRSDASGKQPLLQLADVRAEVLVPVFAQPAAFREAFEAPLAGAWQTAGDVKVDDSNAFRGDGALALRRTLEDVERPTSVIGPTFAAVPGKWEIGLAFASDLHSPDNSYSGTVRVESLEAAGRVVEPFTVVDTFGMHDWQSVRRVVEFPAGTTAARFQVQLNKTYGRFSLDELSASYLAPAPRRDDRIERLMFATSALGNLLKPDDPRTVAVTVLTKKPLRDDQQTLTYVLRDYWGAEQTLEATVQLGSPAPQKDGYVYQATLDLADAPLEVGRYYELHARLPQSEGEPFRNYTSLAVLPEAITRRYKPEEIPFASRNWDNRIPAFVQLSDRLGLRICGIWGGWSAQPPFKPHAPTLDLCRQLGMGWLTTTPAAAIERGSEEYDETALRRGVRNLIETYGNERPLYINLGNEPHGKGERVLKNVVAYKTLYDEIKQVDPSIPVVATSVEPNEEYFAAGYGKACDAFDFHIYEDTENVRRTIDEYRALMKKYDCEKPIWSTELGLNSQGMTRHAVAKELYKKTAVFFASGGERMTWFGLLYPDPDGKSHGSSGDAHNVFDCRFNRYAPRLDAVAYYHAVNSVAIKKFVDEKLYNDGVRAFLFRDRDGRCLQILWKERGVVDATVPLPGVGEVQILGIDGRSQMLDAAAGGITLSLGEDPQLLLYEATDAALAAKLEPSMGTLTATPETVARRGATSVVAEYDADLITDAEFTVPSFWNTQRNSKGGDAGSPAARFTVEPPAGSAVREAEFFVKLLDADRRAVGLLYRRLKVAD